MPKSKFSTKKVHLNPKKKKPNKNHKQKYWKKENKKINKENLIEIYSPREELKDYVGEEYDVQGFLTNTYKYNTRRLVNSIILPIIKDNKKLYIKHAWINKDKVQNISHGYKKFRIKIKKYKDQITNKEKYGIEFIKLLDS
jgi:hypothetical protein